MLADRQRSRTSTCQGATDCHERSDDTTPAGPTAPPNAAGPRVPTGSTERHRDRRPDRGRALVGEQPERPAVAVHRRSLQGRPRADPRGRPALDTLAPDRAGRDRHHDARRSSGSRTRLRRGTGRGAPAGRGRAARPRRGDRLDPAPRAVARRRSPRSAGRPLGADDRRRRDTRRRRPRSPNRRRARRACRPRRPSCASTGLRTDRRSSRAIGSPSASCGSSPRPRVASR